LVAHPDVGTVTRIDPGSGEAVDTIPVGEDRSAIAVDDDAVWVVESGGPSVSRISPETGTVVDTIPVGNGPAGIAIGAGGVWVTNRFDGTLLRIDPARGKVIDTIPVGLDPRGVAVAFESVWVSLSGSNTVVRVDPATNTVVQPIGVGSGPASIAAASDAVWVVNVLDDTVSSITPEGRVSSVQEVGEGPSGIAISRGTVWVSNEGDGTISKIVLSGTSPSPLRIGSMPQGLATVGGDLWVSVRGAATSHRGGTLRVLSRVRPSTLDTNVAYDIPSFRMLHLTGDGLVGLKWVGGADGASLVADLATALPMPTDDGRTYAFELRPGIRYSNGDAVVPSDFRRAFERGFRLDGGDYVALFGRLEGAKACRRAPAGCDLSRGVAADDGSGTVTFHLVKPDPEFLYKLTMPFAYPVPSSVPRAEQRRTGIPGTGPYMLEEPMTKGGLVLTRNPNFRQWSATAQPEGYADRIEWTFGVEPASEVEAVQAGDADLAYDVAGYRGLQEILVRFPAQVYSSPSAATDYLALDAQSPPFNDASVRRALNLAVDRERIAQILGAVPTCQHLPPNFPGYDAYCPYTTDPGSDGLWTAPNLAAAQRLVRRSGTSGIEITVEYPPFYWGDLGQQIGEYLVDLLEDLGYRAHVETESVGAFYAPGTNSRSR
jgi:peptide/nickel transport system substrate-binding protein